MRNPQGCAFICYPEKTIEIDTFSCGHCNRVVHVAVNMKIEQVGDFCRQCFKMICAKCADARVCTPLLARIEQMEERYYRRRQFEMLAGL